MTNFAQYINASELELRCTPVEFAEKLGEPVENVLAWMSGDLIPSNPKIVFLAVEHLKFYWHVETEPMYKHLDEYKTELSRSQTLIKECDELIARIKEEDHSYTT